MFVALINIKSVYGVVMLLTLPRMFWLLAWLNTTLSHLLRLESLRVLEIPFIIIEWSWHKQEWLAQINVSHEDKIY